MIDLIYILAILVLFAVILILLIQLRAWRRRCRRFRIPTGIIIYQSVSRSRRTDQMSILGIAPGATGIFNELPLPAGSVFPAGTQFTWTADDTTNTSLSPSPDGSQVAVAAAPTISGGATGFNLTVKANFTDPVSGNALELKKTVAVPFNLPPPPPPSVPTDIDINQVS